MSRKVQLTVCAVMVHKKRVLLVLHTKLNKWLFPGGHIDENETPDQAVVREVKEETGLDFKPSDYGPIDYTSDIIERNAVPFHANVHSVGDHDHYVSLYMGTVDSEKLEISPESKDARWFTIEEIDRLDTNENIKNVAKYALSRKL